MNKCIFSGFISKKGIELRNTNNLKFVASYTLNVPTREKGKYEFVNCITWGSQAEFLKNNEDNIKSLIVEARYTRRKYKNSDDKDVYVTEFVTEKVEVKEWNRNDGQAGSSEDFMQVDDEDIPF